MAKVTLVDAINMALASEMARDIDVVLIGEDIGANGGVFRATAGLQQRFGRERVHFVARRPARRDPLCIRTL